jgi:hypothetical protein
LYVPFYACAHGLTMRRQFVSLYNFCPVCMIFSVTLRLGRRRCILINICKSAFILSAFILLYVFFILGTKQRHERDAIVHLTFRSCALTCSAQMRSFFILKLCYEQVPGPGQYAIEKPDSLAGRISGGKFNMGNSKNDVDWAIYRGSRTPGPGRYDIGRAERYLMSSPKFSFAGRPAPGTMPEPYAEFGSTAGTRRSRSVSPAADLDASDGHLSWTNKSFTFDPTSLERSREWTVRHTQRMKTAYQEAAVKRRQRSVMGYGPSFFM